MKTIISNPFVTIGYIGPDYFCDRQKETEALLKAISSKRNVTLISLRRMGKTGLLKHVKYRLEHMKQSPTVVYVDLMPTMNANEMLNTFSTALVNLKQKEKNLFEKILTLLTSLRPRLSYDSLTGQPSIELKVESTSEVQFGFNQLLKFISGIKNDVVFMFDEFQQISQYPEKNMEQLFRTIIQSYPAFPCVYSGSSQHMLESMFSSAHRPFYQSSELMYLNKISPEEYKIFIAESFSSALKKIDSESIVRIFNWTRLHTYYVQYVCSLLFENEHKLIGVDQTNHVFHQILAAFDPLFVNYRNLIPAHQFRLLQAIAIENGISQPTSGAFIMKHNLVSASSVATSLKALEEKEMIVNDGDQWIVYDVFFSRWLEYHFSRNI
jgi:uncharacterized protein